ncbi:hypothetical protein JTE90_014718 [Oedothorax gibbosus]|uniref:Uncharacterized protein n=1 Tax=Oedothorax gibbosus TaxID=931172 RepID=A0AAV6UQR7_9ARAC|nr:hypothetical protein JTE90_014718 [Oedothorax gibbosus]
MLYTCKGLPYDVQPKSVNPRSHVFKTPISLNVFYVGGDIFCVHTDTMYLLKIANWWPYRAPPSAMLAGTDGDEDLSWDCGDCPPPPPPRFLIPPPPAPPSSSACSSGAGGASSGELHFCHLVEPVGAEFTQTAFPSLPIIAVCSSVVLVAVLVASFLLWKHKRKVQNFLPCKSHHQDRCDMGGASGITYDDVLINHHPTRLPNHLNPNLNPDANTLTPIELLDVKYGSYVQQHPDTLTRTNFTIPTGVVLNNARGIQQQIQQHQAATAAAAATEQRQARRQNHNSRQNQHRKKKERPFHPIYEEVSGGGTSDENRTGGRSYDSDIDDSEVEGRTVGSEDEFAEDELSVAGLNPEEDPCSATSSLQGSTGGDLGYPDGVTERFSSDGSPARTLKGNFRGVDGHNKLTHSLERNKDGHPSNSFQAKQNYYLNKSMLGPDFTYPEGTDGGSSCVSPSGDMVQSDMNPQFRAIGSSLNFIPALLQQQQQQQYPRGVPMSCRSASNSPPPPPYTSSTTPRQGGNAIPALYNPQVVSPGQRIPDALLRELTSFKIPSSNQAVAAKSSRSLPVPPSCRGSGVLFTVESPYPVQTTAAPLSRTRSGSVTEFTSSNAPRGGGYHQYPHHALGGGRPPTPPPPENIYASIDDVGPYTIDGGRHRSGPFRKGSTEARNTFGRPNNATAGGNRGATAQKPAGGDKFQTNNVPNRHPPNDDGGSYGDIRPIYDSRTACS